jgi:hypothetical protein
MEKIEPGYPHPKTPLGARVNEIGQGEMERPIETMIRQMPRIEPPAGLVFSVIEAIRTKRAPLWLRAYRSLTSPKSFTFNSLRMVSATALLASLVLFALFLHERENRMIALKESPELVPVVLALDMPDAHSVQVVGSFNNWVPQPCSLHKEDGSIRWVLSLRLKPGRYEYAFLVDGKYMPHPESVFYKDDGFGNRNTVVALGKEDDI